MSGVPYHAWTHAPKAQGGTDPIASPGGTTAALLNDIDFNEIGDELIATDDWTLVTPGDGSRFFIESWRADSGWGAFFDGDISFTRDDFALYVAYASIEWTSIPDGTTIGVAIQFSASSGNFHANTREVIGGTTRVNVVAPWWGNLSATRLWCYHDKGTDFSLGPVSFHVRMFELNADGEYEERE